MLIETDLVIYYTYIQHGLNDDIRLQEVTSNITIDRVGHNEEL